MNRAQKNTMNQMQKKIRKLLQQTPKQKLVRKIHKAQKNRERNRQKIQKLKTKYKLKNIKQESKRKDKFLVRIDRILNVAVFLMGAAIMAIDGLLDSRKRHGKNDWHRRK